MRVFFDEKLTGQSLEIEYQDNVDLNKEKYGQSFEFYR